MPEFLRIDGFAKTPDGSFSRRDLVRLWSVGFDLLPLSPPVCPPPGTKRFFRIDEFAVLADGVLDARDRTRFTSVGFDLEPTVACEHIEVYVNAPGVTVLVIVDRDVHREIQFAVVEDPVDSGLSYTSGLWTVQEVIDYMNQRQAEFLKLTSLVLTRARIPTVPQVLRHPLPPDWISTRRIVHIDPAGQRRALDPADAFELDHAKADWQINLGRPKVYSDGGVPTHTVEVAPPSADGGVLELLYTALAPALSNTGVAFKVPAEFVSPIKWGVLASMLGKVGRAHDRRRAEYCETRFREGVEAAKLLLEGWA